MMDTRIDQVSCMTCTCLTDRETAWDCGANCFLCLDCRWSHLKTPAAPKGEVIRLHAAAEPGANWNDLRPLPDWWRTIARIVMWATLIFTPWLVFALLLR